MFPMILKLHVDVGYQESLVRTAVKKAMARVNVEFVKRSEAPKSFVVLPKRRVVERTFAWSGSCRRLGIGLECLNRKWLAFLLLASIRLMPS